MQGSPSSLSLPDPEISTLEPTTGAEQRWLQKVQGRLDDSEVKDLPRANGARRAEAEAVDPVRRTDRQWRPGGKEDMSR